MIDQRPGVGIDLIFINIIDDPPAGVIDSLISIISSQGCARAISPGGASAGCYEEKEEQESGRSLSLWLLPAWETTNLAILIHAQFFLLRNWIDEPGFFQEFSKARKLFN
jgi:hypothetical protein